MKYNIGQTVYVVKGFLGFRTATGIKLPIKCTVEDYNPATQEYSVLVLQKKPKVHYSQLNDGTYLTMEESHSLTQIPSDYLVGVV